MNVTSSWLPLIEGLLESVLIVDGLDLKVLAVNRTACTLLGLEAEAVVGHPVLDFAASPEDVFFWEEVAAGLVNEIFSETVLRRADGTLLTVDRRVSRVKVDDFHGTGRMPTPDELFV